MVKTTGAGRPPKKAGGLSKSRVMDAALSMIDKEGDNAASFRALAKRLNVTPMAVAHHVGSRHDMLSGLIVQVFEGVGGNIAGETPAARLRAILVRYCERALQHPNLIRCAFADPTLITGDLKLLTENIRTILADYDDANDTILNLIVDYTHGFVLSAAAAPDTFTLSTADYLQSLDWVLDRIDA